MAVARLRLFSLILGQLDSDAGDLLVNPKDVIAHVAQESPTSESTALSLSWTATMACASYRPALPNWRQATRHDERLHSFYEEMDNIDGYTAETRAARLLHGLGFDRGSHAANPSMSSPVAGACG